MKNKKHIVREKLKNVSLALLIGALATGIDAAVGHPTINFAAVIAIMASAYILADTHGWLIKNADEETQHRRIYGPLALYAVLVVLYMAAIDGDQGAPLAALYLPVVLAVICYKVRIGLAVSGGVAGLYVLHILTQHPHSALTMQDIGALASFPITTMFIAGMAQRLEDRFHALYDKTSELSALLDMSQMMDAASDLDTTLNLILLNVQQQSSCQVCAIYLTNSNEPRLELRAASGPRNRLALAPTLLISEAACGDWTLQQAAHQEADEFAFFITDVRSVSAHLAESPLLSLDRRAASLAIFPLASVDGLLGLLYLGFDNTNGLVAGQISRLGHLAVRAAFSLQRAVLQQGFRSLAYSDAMTGLDNFRQFEQDLGDELRRAERYDRALSVILLDIDYFKKFNDTLGHQAGDALLAQLASVLRDSLRSLDKPARYGGEEFVVICPETGKDEARLIAERIRSNVETTAFALLAPEQQDPVSGKARVTVSVGFATFPFDAASGRELVKSADDALYAAKHAGRNTVRSHDEIFIPQDKVAA